MLSVERTDSSNKDFIELVKLLDADLAIRDGEDHAFYAQFSKIDNIKFVIMVYEEEWPIGCGAIREYDAETMEVKRMYTAVEGRRKGVASRILSELENWASELSYQKCILETGINQPEAIALYEKRGYQYIDNYDQYAGVATSVCFMKRVGE